MGTVKCIHFNGGLYMTKEPNTSYLSIALIVVGLIFIFGIYAMMSCCPDSWAWMPRQPEYEQMIMGIYATLGVFLLWASKNPLEHRSLIWFTVWSSVVHGGIMLIQAITDSSEHHNLYGDIPALFFVAIILGGLMPRKRRPSE